MKISIMTLSVIFITNICEEDNFDLTKLRLQMLF